MSLTQGSGTRKAITLGISMLFAMGAAIGTRVAIADSVQVTSLGPGVQTPNGITNQYETFNGLSYNGTSLTTNFNGSGITGTYTGDALISSANLYGGAGGVGQYIATSNAFSYALTLSSDVNYFGLWFSALDQGNGLAFYRNNTLVYSFTPADYEQLVGACPETTTSPNYCGNPNANFYDQNSGQQYAYLNFYDRNASFNKIVFSQTPNDGEFESDNQAVANLASAPGGTPLVAVPEPPGLLLIGTGVLFAAGFVRRRFAQ